MSVYELMEGKEVNGRGVWQMAGGQECFMYYAKRDTPDDKRWHWWINGKRASMEAGKASGQMKVADAGVMFAALTALTPDQVTETWQITPEWVDAPKVRARMCSAEEKRAAAERLEQERQQATAGAGAAAAAGDGGGEAGEGCSHVGLYLDVSRRM
jgi:hypothetical protein